jgi:hypothetical protein
MAIPLQSLLLAEMFEGKLKEYSTTLDLPEYINIVIVYNLYIEKKWGIHLQEKRGCNKKHVMGRNDDEELHKTFMENHMAAVLVTILSTHETKERISDKMDKRSRNFLNKITKGVEKTGIVIEVIEGRPVFQHRTIAEYLTARWLCDNIQNGQTFMRDHLFETVLCGQEYGGQDIG